MDVLYYTKDIENDLSAGNVGSFRSDKGKLAMLKAGYPDFIWILGAPAGRPGDVQLLARLAWLDVAPKGFKPPPEQSVMFYDVEHPRSGRFDRTLSEAGIEQTSRWMRGHFPAALKARFQGQNGQQELRGEPLRQLQQIASTWPMEPIH